MQDAAAICEPASRPEMRFLSQKLIQQQDMQMLHRIRSLRKQLVKLTSEPHVQLTAFAQELLVSLSAELCSIDEHIEAMEKRIQQALQREEACQKIAQVEGVGPVIATARVAASANGKAFRNGQVTCPSKLGHS